MHALRLLALQATHWLVSGLQAGVAVVVQLESAMHGSHLLVLVPTRTHTPTRH